ncbi:MAG: ATP-binding cassette domain-containing protein [Alsobacter sp.]
MSAARLEAGQVETRQAADHAVRAIRGSDVRALAWPAERLPEGIAALARRTGLDPAQTDLESPDSLDLVPAEIDRWFAWAGQRFGIGVDPVDTDLANLPHLLAGGGPAVIRVAGLGPPRFLMLLPSRPGMLRVLTPDGTARRCPPEALRATLASGHETGVGRDVVGLLDVMSLAGAKRRTLQDALVRARVGEQRIEGIWLLNRPAGSSFWAQLRAEGVVRRVALLVVALAAAAILEIAAWQVIGGSALSGRGGDGWLTAWVLLLATLVALQGVASWLSSRAGLDAARLLKARLLAGSLRMPVDEIRQEGAGGILARTMEGQALEGVGLAAALSTLNAGVELAVAAWVLAQGAGGLWHLASLAAFVAAAVPLAWTFHDRLLRWTRTRQALTRDLAERMIGHRTVLAQDVLARRQRTDDGTIRSFLEQSADLDDSSVPLLALLPMAWTIAALAGLAPAVLGGQAGAVNLAVAVGGLVLGGRGLTALCAGFAAAARAWVAWRQVEPLFRAASETPETRPYVTLRDARRSTDTPLVDAEGLTFGHPSRSRPVLDNGALTLRHGDRVIVEGPSGGGKSTLASLLTGLRTPRSGLLLLNGLDRHTLGSAWHDIATQAPQFGDNHLVSASLAFNLLMGRGWPCSTDDLADAERMCQDLGLGELLARMPAGLMQQVGETGWQLSHGERSRVFLARALLQGAPLVILDESFGALDPETVAQCVACANRHAGTLVVIAHP